MEHRAFAVFPPIGEPSHGVAALLRRYRVFLVTLAVGALVLVMVALLGAGGSTRSSTPSLPAPSPNAVPPAQVGSGH